MADIPITHRALSSDERDAMEQALRLAGRMAKKPVPLGFADVQQLYDDALAQADRDDEHVIAVGIAFGAAINERAGFDWVRVSDQWGDETCVGPGHKTIHCAPISMVQKRLSRQEPVDLRQLADTVINSIREKIADGQTGGW
jgi:hypothetical protein